MKPNNNIVESFIANKLDELTVSDIHSYSLQHNNQVVNLTHNIGQNIVVTFTLDENPKQQDVIDMIEYGQGDRFWN